MILPPVDLRPPPALVTHDERPWTTLNYHDNAWSVGCDAVYELDGKAVGRVAFWAGLKTFTGIEVAGGWVVKLTGRSGD
jgi:hypothetical protein